MTTPTITTITPTTGHTGGKMLVEIAGTGFRLPTAPPAQGIAPVPARSVRVFFGTVEADAVLVAGADLLYCTSPIHDPGKVGVTVQNIADDGAAIAGEQVTKANGFEFVRPDLSKESTLAAVFRALIVELERQVIDNVHLATSTDYDEESGDLLSTAFVAKLPAIVLSNVELVDEKMEGRKPEEYPVGDSRFIVRRPPAIYDVVLLLVGAADNPILLLNLTQAVRMFFAKNTALRVPRDPESPTGAFVEYPIDFTIGSPIAVSASSSSPNVGSFNGQIAIRGVRLEDMPGLSSSDATTEYGWTGDAVSIESQER